MKNPKPRPAYLHADWDRHYSNQRILHATLATLACTVISLHAATQGLPLTVHEWGTFTTVSTSDGRALSGLFIDASPLPAFVHTLPFFAGAPAPLGPTSNLLASDSALSDLSAKWRGVATKMETPVLYFYADSDRPYPMTVKAQFPGGTLHQFYPPRQGGEENPKTASIDFGMPRTGSLEWQVEILPQKLTDSTYQLLTHPDGGQSQEWLAPRRPRSNLLRAGDEVESYLFYRGLAGALPLPLKMRFPGDSTLELTNTCNDTLAHIVVYEQEIKEAITQAGSVWWQGSLRPGETLRLRLDTATLPKHAGDREAAYQSMKTGMHEQLEKAGLYFDEASAMLNTWERSYWGDERGLKVFWIVPRKIIDTLLPLTLSSEYGFYYSIERVFIARSEILTPAFERKLRAGHAIDAYDRHRLAYQAAADMSPLLLESSIPGKKNKNKGASLLRIPSQPYRIPVIAFPRQANGRLQYLPGEGSETKRGVDASGRWLILP